VVKDANGNPVAQVAVTFAVAPGNGTITGASQTTNASGVATVGSWTRSATAGPNTLTATSGSLSGSPVTFTATGTAGTAATIAANSATSQSATAGTAVSTPPSVIVKDANGNPVTGVAVTFAVAPGNGTITGASQTTNASGVATVGSWTLSATAGPNTLTATSTGLSGSPVTFSATGTAGTAATIAANSATSQSAAGGEAGRAAPAGSGGDANGNPGAGGGGAVGVGPGGGGGGHVHPGGGEWQRDGRDANHERQRHRHGRELDAERDRRQQHPNGHVRVAHGEPGHLYGDGDGRGGGDDRGEQCDEPVGR